MTGSRGRQLRLLLAVARALVVRARTISDLIETTGAERRTLYRVLAEMRAAEIPLEHWREGKIAWWRMGPDWWHVATPRRGRVSARERSRK